MPLKISLSNVDEHFLREGKMTKTIQFLLLSWIAVGQVAFSAEVYKENFPGGVYIYDGDEPYVSKLEVPNDSRPMKGTNTDLIINTLEKGLFDKWAPKMARALTYCISDTFGDSKNRIVDAFDTATGDWMNAGNVKYVYMPQHDAKCDQANANVVFDVRLVTKQPYLARAFFPNTKRISRNILVDSSSLKYDDVALAGFLRHELGHTLGFRHEHISKSSKGLCPEDEAFKPLTSYDPTSVMHYPQCGGANVITNMVLSAKDEEGARAVYPFK
jgi:serralysin